MAKWHLICLQFHQFRNRQDCSQIMLSPVPLGEEFRVEEITGTEWVPLTYELRYRVWSREVQLPESFRRKGLIRDEHEDHARHWAVLSDAGILVASARLCVHESERDIPEADCYTQLQVPHPVASINRLVVEQSARKRNLAQALDLQRIEAAKGAGAACIVVAPTDDRRVRALGKVGFSLTSSKCKSIYLDDLWLPVMVLNLQTVR
jgi:predicted GNAT family N-acyltransferase